MEAARWCEGWHGVGAVQGGSSTVVIVIGKSARMAAVAASGERRRGLMGLALYR